MSDVSVDFFVGLETNVWEALCAGDPVEDRTQLSDDFLGVYPTGYADASDHAGELADGATVVSYEIIAPRIRVFTPDHVLLAYEAAYQRPRATPERMFVSSVWSRRDDGWVNVFSQDTPVADVDAPVSAQPAHERAEDERRLERAIVEAEIGEAAGGVPIGAALIADDGTVLGAGHNRRVQHGSAIRHGETDALEQAGRLGAEVYRQCTMYTTLSPCSMCTGALLLYGIPRVVIGENRSFLGEEQLLRSRGVEVIVLDSARCKGLMDGFIAEHPEIWFEDIGEHAP